MKKILTALLCALIVICFAGCSQKEDTFETKAISRNKTVTERSMEGESIGPQVSSNQEEIDVSYMEEYHDERAWVCYKVNDYPHFGIIDMTGNVIASYGTDITYTPFDNSYAHVCSGNTYYTINSDGEIVNQFLSDPSGELLTGKGGGYIVTVEDNSGFDSTKYHYRVYNPDGGLNGSFTTEKKRNVAYIGRGVFEVGEGFYCAENGKWIESVKVSTKTFAGTNFDGDNIIIGTIWDERKSKMGIVILSVDGAVKEIYLDELSNYASVSGLADNCCIFFDYNRVLSYNVISGECYTLENTYYEKMEDWAKPEAPQNGRIVIPMEGADGKTYSAIFDIKFNLVAGPISGAFGTYYEGRARASVERKDRIGEEVYDTNGELVYSISDLGYDSIGSEYSCGALLVRNGKNDYAFLDINGNFLFDNITFNGTKYINLE